jgi:hypothetical protein
MSIIGTFAIGAALFFGSIGTCYALSFIMPSTDDDDRKWAEKTDGARTEMHAILKEEGWLTSDINKAEYRKNRALRRKAIETIQRREEWSGRSKKMINKLLLDDWRA